MIIITPEYVTIGHAVVTIVLEKCYNNNKNLHGLNGNVVLFAAFSLVHSVNV